MNIKTKKEMVTLFEKMMGKLEVLIEIEDKKRKDEKNEHFMNTFKDHKKRHMNDIIQLPTKFSSKNDHRVSSHLKHFYDFQQHFIKEFTDYEKQWFVNRIKQEVHTYDFWQSEEINEFYKKNVKRKKERIRLIMKGEDLTNCAFLTEQQEREINEKLCQLFLWDIEYEIGLKEKKDGLEWAELLLSFEENPYINSLPLEKIFQKTKMKNLDQQEKMKETLKTWFQKNRTKWIENVLLNVQVSDIKTIDELYYILTEKQQKEVKEKATKHIQTQFEYVEKGNGNISLEMLETLKEDMLRVQNW